ncbi:MFS transporter [Allorhizocola rhizosphaerae]|uniref:MFS transporter n=1 Tax=Allorhizocola rhizosphaerae TaxID=1872709 RepID=UPI001FE29CB4|nr:MFS transporter [Allorhizocola rhizosphaerae]
MLGAAGFRSAPSVLMVPLQDEFSWPRGEISVAVSINLLLFGLIAPFAAALIEQYGIRRVIGTGLALITLGSALPIFMNASWQLILFWGVLVGAGTGSMALVFAATVVNRWFVKHRGLVTGILTAAGATGQLIFLPLLASLASSYGWRTVSLVVAGCTLAMVPLVFLFLKERPTGDPYGGKALPSQPAGSALGALRSAARTRTFWLLAGGFAICGATTNGLIGTHFLPAAHDHGMAPTTAAGLLALIGVFDIIGTIGSGWLTDRMDSRVLLGVYYGLRGLSLLSLPLLLSDQVRPSLLLFVVFYGLDWIATVPPTVALCRENFGASGTIVFGWVFASHQIGAAIAATAAGYARDAFGDYGGTWIFTGVLAIAAAGLSVAIRARQAAIPARA